MNHLNFDQRLDLIKSLLRDDYNLEAIEITPIEYDPECLFPYNNFIYRLRVSPSTGGIKPRQSQPGTVALPENISELVIRLTNNAALGINNHNRVENEVASMHLARQALGQSSNLIPEVYNWSSALSGQGWILMQYMPGIPLDQKFSVLSENDKGKVLEEMATVIYAFQRFRLPETIKGYGGLTFDEDGNIVGGQMTTVPDGPFEDLESLYRALLVSQIAESERSSVLKGWRFNDIRNRLDKFVSKGLGKAMGDSIQEKAKVLVHGDFTTNNILFDPETVHLTAIIDFDWAHIAGIADEFCRSFAGEMGCKFSGPHNDDAEQLSLEQAFLTGFPDPLTTSETIPWATAKTWDEKLALVGARQPATIQGLSDIAGLFWLSDQISPFILTNEMVMQNFTKEQVESNRDATAQLIHKYLEKYGY